MSLFRVINAAAAPKPVGPYSQAVLVEKTLYVSGVLGMNPETGKLVSGTAVDQAKQIFQNMKAILQEAGCTFQNVVKTTILLDNLDDFAAINTVYQDSFQPPYPARSTYQVAKLPLGAKVEIEAIAQLK